MSILAITLLLLLYILASIVTVQYYLGSRHLCRSLPALAPAQLMLSLRCCSSHFANTFIFFTRLHSHLAPNSIPFSLCAKPFSPKPLIFSANPNLRPMSTRRSAFDVLMANSKKKSQTQTPPAQEASPKKRKTAEKDAPEQKSSSVSAPGENASSNEVKAIEKAGSVNGQRNDGDSSSLGEEVAAKKPKLISPDESVAELKKKAANFDPKKAAYWGDGERVPFMFVAKAFSAIEEESGRIAITDIVTNMLRTVIHTTPDDLLPAVYLSANKIAPAHEGLELGIGDASIIKALAEACGAKEAHIKKQYKVGKVKVKPFILHVCSSKL